MYRLRDLRGELPEKSDQDAKREAASVRYMRRRAVMCGDLPARGASVFIEGVERMQGYQNKVLRIDLSGKAYTTEPLNTDWAEK